MTRPFWYRLTAGSLFLVVALTVVCLRAEFSFRSPRNPQGRIVMRGEFAIAMRDGWVVDPQGARIPVPVIRIPEKEHDFGWSDPHKYLSFQLPVHNVGRADLRLSVSSDTLSVQPAELVIAPGESATVELT